MNALLLLAFLACTPPVPTDSMTVYVFLHDECVVSQFYTPALRRLHDTYAGPDVSFVGYFPNPAATPERIYAFAEKYELPFPLYPDHFKRAAHRLGATVTPEAVVYDHAADRILYRGRIDNSFVRVGRRRQVTTSFELETVLKKRQPPAARDTPAVGCLINFNDPLYNIQKTCTPEAY